MNHIKIDTHLHLKVGIYAEFLGSLPYLKHTAAFFYEPGMCKNRNTILCNAFSFCFKHIFFPHYHSGIQVLGNVILYFVLT